MSRCPPLQQLSAYLDGTLPLDDLATVERHVRDCIVCEAVLSDLRALPNSVARSVGAVPLGQGAAPVVIHGAGGVATAEAGPVKLGPYELLRKLGQGGMGTVYQARHIKLDRIEAVKILPQDLMKHPQAVERFEREMRAVAKLDHPHIVRAHHAGEEQEQHYLVMEHVDGQDVTSLIKRCGQLRIPDACEIVRQAAEGLQHAFEHGMVHRDIKPSNLIVSRKGVVKILDLGLALVGNESGLPAADLTSAGQIMGTLDYMAPEQGGNAHQVDIRADLYSLGATLYHLLAGQAPFGGRKYASHMQKLVALATESPTPIRELRPEVPVELATLLHRLLVKDPQDRIATPAEVAIQIKKFTDRANLVALVAEVESTGTEAPVSPVASTVNFSVASESGTHRDVKFGAASAQPSLPGKAPAEPSAVSDKAGVGANPISPPPGPKERTGAGGGEPISLDESRGPASNESITVAPTHLSSRTRQRRLLALIGVVAVAVLAFVVIRVSTNRGDLVITSTDPGVKVAVKKSGKTVDEWELKQGENKYTLWSGDYEVELSGQFDGLTVKHGQFTLTRGGTRQVLIERTKNVDSLGSAVVAIPKSGSATPTNGTTDAPADYAAERKAAEWVLSVGGILDLIDEQGRRCKLVDGMLPTQTFAISGAIIEDNPTVRDDDLANLGRCRRMVYLLLGKVSITGSGLKHLATVSSLQRLNLIAIDTLNDKGMESIALLHQIRELEIVELLSITDKAMESIGKLRQLERVTFNVPLIGDSGLARLGEMSHLRTIHVGNRTTDSGIIQLLKDHPQLQSLGVTDSRLPPKRTLVPLANARNLRELAVTGSQITIEGLEVLQRIPTLESLDVGTHLSTDDVLRIAKVSQLKKLRLHFSHANSPSPGDLAFEALVDLRLLEDLDVQGHAASPSDKVLETWSKLPQLKKLYLRHDDGKRRYTTTGIATFRKIRPDVELNVDGIIYPATPRAEIASTLEQGIRSPQAVRRSPWDALDPGSIPESELGSSLPAEVVAVLGSHRQRHAHSISSGIAVRPDGKRFATMGRDGMRFWDGTTFQELGRIGLAERNGPSSYETAAYFAQGRKLVVSWQWSNGEVWQLDDSGLKVVSTEPLPAGNSERMSRARFIVSPNDRWLIRQKDYFSNNHLTLFSLADDKYRIVAEYPDYHGADFSPDSRFLAICGGKDKSVRVLELGKDEPVERQVLKPGTEATADHPSLGFLHLAYVSDGRLATADGNGRTWFWDLEIDSDKPLFSAKGSDPQYPLHAARTAPIVECAGVVWSVEATQAKVIYQALFGGEAHGESARPESNLHAFALLPDGQTAISGHLNGSVRIWDLTGEKVKERNPLVVQPLGSPYVHLVQLLGVIATRDEQNHLRLWQPTAKGLVEHPASQSDELANCLPLTASEDGKLLVTGATNGTGCVIWNWDGEHLTPHLRVGRYGTRSASLSSDGRLLAIGQHWEEGVDVWDITARPPKLERSLPPPDNKIGGDQVLFVKGDSQVITKMGPAHTIWNLADEQPVAKPLLLNQLEGSPLAYSSSHNLLLAVTSGTQLLTFGKSPPQPLYSLPSNLSERGSAAFSGDGKQVAVTDYRHGDQTFLDVYNTETGLRQHRIPLLFSPRRMAFTPDNRHLVTANENGTVYVLRLSDGRNGASAKTESKTASPNTGWHGRPADAPPAAIAPLNTDQAKTHQQAWANYLKVPVEYTNSIGMKFRLIPPGEFLMGSTKAQIENAVRQQPASAVENIKWCRNEGPQHRVILTRPFYLGVHEVTQRQFEAATGRNPSLFSREGQRKTDVSGVNTDNHPVEFVNWADAAEFCANLDQREKLKPFYFRSGSNVTRLAGGTGYRLPTEAEWEFACRAGTITNYWNGDSVENLMQVGWFNDNSGNRTHAVGELQANPFGLFDVHGNVHEYCQDWYDDGYYESLVAEQPDAVSDPAGPPARPNSVAAVRGGGCQNRAVLSRSASRLPFSGGAATSSQYGFRVVLTVDAVNEALAAENNGIDQDRDVAWWALTHGGEVVIELDGTGTTINSVAGLPANKFSVNQVYLHHRPMRVDGLEKLFGLPRLHVLRLVEVPFGDECTRSIGRLTGLLHLQLNNCKITDVGLARLKDLSKLQYLDLNWQPGITDKGLEVVRGMRQLGQISMIQTSVTDAGLEHLRGLPLQDLALNSTKISDAGMKHISEFKALGVLGISHTSVTDEGVSQLRTLSNLRMLSLAKTSVTDRALEHLTGMPLLRELVVFDTKVTKQGIAALQKQLPSCKIVTEDPIRMKNDE